MEKTPPPPPAYIDHLRSLPDRALVALLAEHWLLCSPPVPQTFPRLAAEMVRLGLSFGSEPRLNRFELEVRDCLRILGPRGVPRGELAAELGPTCDRRALNEVIGRLLGSGLAWEDADGVHLLDVHADPTIQDRKMAGLGRPVRALLAVQPRERLDRIARAQGLHGEDPVDAIAIAFTDADAVRRLVAALDPRARKLVEVLATTEAQSSCWLHGDEFSNYGKEALFDQVDGRDARSLVDELADRALLLPVPGSGEKVADFGARLLNVELPREVGLALRGPSPYGRLHPRAPALDAVDVGVGIVDRAGAAEVLATLETTARLLAVCGSDPPTNRRWRRRPHDREPIPSAGIDERELDRLAAATGIDTGVLPLLLEVCAEAGLLTLTPDEEMWLPTPAHETWLSDRPSARWTMLARTWIDMRRSTHHSTAADDEGPVLGPVRSTDPGERRALLGVLAELLPGHAAAPGRVVALLDWRNTCYRYDAPARVLQAAQEAAALGLIGRDALTSYARGLLSGDTDLRALDRLLPAIVRPPRREPRTAAALADLRERRVHASRYAVPEPESRRYRPEPRWEPDDAERALIVHAWRQADRHPNPPAREPHKIAVLRAAAAELSNGNVRRLDVRDPRGRSWTTLAEIILVTGGVVLAIELIDGLSFTMPTTWITRVSEVPHEEYRRYAAYRAFPAKPVPDPRRPVSFWDVDLAEVWHPSQSAQP
ncbi:hypothetical protein [Actinomadura flavalba]|uniref:hypothetical protein n=1 Tax=Actinomadura flavalba TaxID=1120938 RepID=UPI00039AF4D1|nr:hypothetical protein [Actinomadura flavalba]